MLIPDFQPSEHSKKQAPKWMNVDEINKNVNASKAEIANKIQKSAGIVQSHQEHVISYGCGRCSKVYNVDDRRLIAQANLMQALLQKEGDWRCPDCKGQLSPYETRPILNKLDNKHGNLEEKRTDLEVEAGYNTTVDRLLVSKTLDALAKYASKMGMSLPVVKYLKANRMTNASDNKLDYFNNIECQLEWRYGRNQLGRITASVGIDQAGNYEMPRIFAFAGNEYPFEKKYIQKVEKELRQVDLTRKPKASDWLNVKKPDPTRFRGATASLDKEADMSTPLAAPTAPISNNQPQQYQPNQQVVNPADGKTYQVVNHDQNTGMTVTDPMTGTQSMIPKDQVQNVKPAVQTQASLIEGLVNDELKKKAFSVTSIVNDLLGDMSMPADPLHEDVGVLNPDMVCPQCKNKGMKFIVEDDELGNEEGFQCPKCGHYANKHDLNPPINPSYARVASMSRNWANKRKELLAEKENLAKNTPKQPLSPSRMSFQEQTIQDLTKKGYKGFKPESTEATESGRTENGVPVGESKDIEIGMTDFPDYTKPFQEAQQEMVDAREHFPQEDMLPMRHLRVDKLKDFTDGKKDEKNYGLSNVKEEFENPKLQFESAQSLIREIAKEAAGILPDTPFPDNLMDAQVGDVDAYLDEKASTGSIRGNGWSMINEVASQFPNVDKGTIKQRMIEKGLINKLAAEEEVTFYQGYGWYDVFNELGYSVTELNGGDGMYDAGEYLFTDPITGRQVTVTENGDGEFKVVKGRGFTPEEFQKLLNIWDDDNYPSTASLKTAAEEAIDKAINEKVVPVVEKPVVYKENKTAPKLEGITEPAVIEQVEGKGKEAITKLRNAQKELKTLQEEMAAKLKPFQDSLMEKSKEYAGPMKSKVDAVTTYVNMAFDQLSLLETSTVAYEEEIYAAIQRSKAEAGNASLVEILKKAEEIAPQVAEEIKKIKAAIENDRTTEVIEKFLYNYPQSKSHEKKVRTSSEESGEIDGLLKGWLEIVKSLLNLNTLMIA